MAVKRVLNHLLPLMQRIINTSSNTVDCNRLLQYRYDAGFFSWSSLSVCLQHALDLQLAVANILQLLVNSERNQQVLCEACLHQRLLQRCSQALGDEDHPLHPPLQRMFERLASQALQPMALRCTDRRVALIFTLYYKNENKKLMINLSF